MALSPLSEFPFPSQTFQPFAGRSVIVPADNTGETDDESSELITDPELRVQKQLIEELFEQKEKRKNKSAEKEKEKDLVRISARALELYKEEYTSLVLTTDSARIEIQYERLEYMRVEQTDVPLEEAEPLVLDLNGNGIELTDVRTGDGVSFDITGDGIKEEVSWVSPSDGLLVYDRNGNGIIDNGKELFGDQHGAAHGFEELAKFDSDANGSIDNKDSVFSELKVWQDHNQNGLSDNDELQSLDAYGITAINLEKDDSRTVIAGNRIEGYSSYQKGTSSGRIGEVFFNYYV